MEKIFEKGIDRSKFIIYNEGTINQKEVLNMKYAVRIKNVATGYATLKSYDSYEEAQKAFDAYEPTAIEKVTLEDEEYIVYTSKNGNLV